VNASRLGREGVCFGCGVLPSTGLVTGGQIARCRLRPPNTCLADLREDVFISWLGYHLTLRRLGSRPWRHHVGSTTAAPQQQTLWQCNYDYDHDRAATDATPTLTPCPRFKRGFSPRRSQPTPQPLLGLCRHCSRCLGSPPAPMSGLVCVCVHALRTRSDTGHVEHSVGSSAETLKTPCRRASLLGPIG
jgi:hypothetical protein